jgi:YgiT-type zinc finger domain-containing protein
MGRWTKEEEIAMTCHVCGASLRSVITDLPFKVSNQTIVIVKDLPVFQCGNCQEYLIEDVVMERVEKILTSAGSESELNVVRFAA